MKNNAKMKIVTLDAKYINYLSQFDSRVCYNKDGNHTRPYIGVVFALRNFEYFAPLTSSGKGKKLISKPKNESITFYPIDNCNLGGINLNNMIPITNNVVNSLNLNVTSQDSKSEMKYKILLMQQLNFCNAHEKEIRTKANKIYAMKTQNKLFPNYDSITCDFKLLESKAKQYK